MHGDADTLCRGEVAGRAPWRRRAAADPRSLRCAAGEDIVEASGKMVVLDRMLSKLKDRGHRVTLFSQYNRMLDVIEDYLIYRGYKCARHAMRLLCHHD
jgi:SNF2 family DNA or RNA helicase